MNTLTKNSKIKRDFWLVDQLRRAAISVVINIVEGYGRGTKKDFSRFISISLGSINEVKALCDVIRKIYEINEIVELKEFYTKLGKRTYSFRRILKT